MWLNFFGIFGQKFGGYFQMLLKFLPLVTTAVKSVSQPEIEIGQMLHWFIFWFALSILVF